MAFEKLEILKRRLRNYCNVNAFDLIALKANLDAPGNAEIRDIFRAELEDAIASDVLPQAEYEKLTAEEFEDDAEYRDNLRGIHAYLFEGAPHP
ncbi:hypothetical protein [Pukyongiella litopenaei]|uniref:Uncharacterized protein n=1 Tax=Pukyongiella litopenaei TaxID=2605946 RepID=A0A2S0MN44_9RHOB|nr:hypothetical protein [Pukyongiella litopenaei]AVO37295.1 hypothetical protein C6Y53_05915 [Pukyongiella litopenaei]